MQDNRHQRDRNSKFPNRINLDKNSNQINR